MGLIYLGKFENILQAMELLRDCRFDVITYDVKTDQINIIRYPDINKGWTGEFNILFNSDKNNRLNIFFGITGSSTTHPDKKNKIEDRGMMVFSGENLFHHLHLPYPHLQGNTIQDLSTLSQAVQANFSCINNAFSKENIQTTCLTLQKMEQGNLDEIKQAFEDASGFE